MLGDQIKYVLRVESEKGMKIQFPVFSDTITSELEILNEGEIDTVFVDDSQVLTRELTVTSFSPGWNTVPPQPFVFTYDAFNDTVYTAALLLTVLSPDVDTTQAIKPIKPPINTPLSLQEALPWVLIIFGIAGLISLLAYLIWRYGKKKKDPMAFVRKPQEPAHILAFRELDRLQEEELPKKGMVKEYYSRLTDIIRLYITRQYDIHAMESTTREILEAFNAYDSQGGKLSDMLEDLLMLADLVKFAKEDPLMNEIEDDMKNAREFVEITRTEVEEEVNEEDLHPADSNSALAEKNLPEQQKKGGDKGDE